MQTKFDSHETKKESHSEHLKGKRVYEGLGDRGPVLD